MSDEKILTKAKNGDINSFQVLFSRFQPQLKSYLFRLTANRNDAEDLVHDTFIKSFDKIETFKGDSELKTWVFRIATNMAYNMLKRRSKWTEDVSEQAKSLVLENPWLQERIGKIASSSPHAKYDIKEHIDTCFTCIGKNLPVENQVALILKDVYDFKVSEITMILGKSEGTIKYLLQHARKSMTDIFERRCALVNKKGVCNQCSELNGWFNPKQDQNQALMKVELHKKSNKYNREKLFKMRVDLVKAINPLSSNGNQLQEILLDCNRMAMGEMAIK